MESKSVLPEAFITILKALRDPANAHFCANMYLITLRIAAKKVNDALREKDTRFLKLVVVFIKFLAMPFQEPQAYAALRERLFGADCHCAEEFPEFYQMCRQEGGFERFLPAENLDSFFESTYLYVNMILSQIKVPSVNTTSEIWLRRLAEVIEKHAGSLVASMTFWLSRNEGLFELELFATLTEISWVGISDAIMASAAFWVSFDKCLHRLVSTPYKLLPGEHQLIDGVFRGVAGVAFAASFASKLGGKKNIPSSNAKGRYTDICLLLSMKHLAGSDIREGKDFALFELATFAEKLCKSCPGEQLSTHAVPLLEDLARAPKTSYWLHVYFAASDRCHNWRSHTTGSGNAKPSAREYSLLFKERVRHSKRLQACSGCRAAHYCSRECQREDWISGLPSHKTLCPILRKLFDVHDEGEHKSMPYPDVKKIYDDLDIPESDIKLAAGHARKMFYYFSQYESET